MKFALKTDYRTSPPKVFKRGKKGIYQWRQRIAGRDVWRSLHTTNKNEAEALAYRLWYAHQNPDLMQIIDTPDFPIIHAWQMHELSEKYALLAESSQRTRECNFFNFESWCQNRGINSINALEKDIITIYFDEHPCANKTFNNILNDLKQVFKQFYQSQNISSPFSGIEQKSITRGAGASVDYRAFSDTEIDKIFRIINDSKLKNKEEWILACEIALNTGLRYKDIAFLQWSHINNNEYIELTPHKTRASNKAVIIRLSAHLRKILSSAPKKDFFVLPGLAKSYSYKSTKSFMRLLSRHDFPGKVGFHSFRSTFITWAGKAGIDLEALGGVVGHASKAMTEHYNKNAIEVDLSFLDSKKYVANASK